MVVVRDRQGFTTKGSLQPAMTTQGLRIRTRSRRQVRVHSSFHCINFQVLRSGQMQRLQAAHWQRRGQVHFELLHRRHLARVWVPPQRLYQLVEAIESRREVRHGREHSRYGGPGLGPTGQWRFNWFKTSSMSNQWQLGLQWKYRSQRSEGSAERQVR